MSSKEVEFKTMKEGWNIYQVEDGIYIKVKLIPTKIMSTDEIDQEGLPIYKIYHQIVMVATYNIKLEN